MGRLDNKALVLSLARAAAVTTLTFKASRYIPRGVKWFFVFLVALNLRSFPLLWHIRVVVPWFAGILKQKWVHDIHGRHVHLKRLTSVSPVYKNPFTESESWKSRAGIADCDYNGHLSNSSYAKNIDYCRLNAAVHFHQPLIGLGCHLPIAGTHHMFLKEIPLNAEYEILMFVPGWEEHKWSYLTIAFITRSKHKGNGKGANTSDKSAQLEKKAEAAAKELLKGVPTSTAGSAAPKDTPLATSDAATPASASASLVIVPPVTEVGSTPSTDSSALTSGISTPLPAPLDFNAQTNGVSSPSSKDTSPAPSPEMEEALKLIRLRIPEDATLHAVAVSQYCFKIGRITIPPRVAFTASGLGDPSLKRWDRLQQILREPGGDRKMRQILKGGWRDRETWGDFWDFKEFEDQARKASSALKQLRIVMGALGGEI